MKCFGYKEISKNVQTIGADSDKAEGDQELLGQSDFCRINPQNAFTFVSKTLHGFVIGPHNFSDEGGKKSLKNFAPIVYFTDENTGETKAYQLLVYIGHKTMLTLLFDQNYKFEYNMLIKLDAHLQKHAPIISQLIDTAVTRVLQPDDPCKFFYYNEGNMAVKVSNQISKDIFNYELKLSLNQMHESFADDPDLHE